MFFVCLRISLVYGCLAMLDNFTCVEYSSSIQHEKKACSDFVQNGKNVIFMNLIYNYSVSNLLPLDEMKSKKWLWIEQNF